MRPGPFALALICLLLPAMTAAQEGGALPLLRTEDGLDASFAREAVLRGEILSLDRILDVLRGVTRDKIIEIQLEYDDGRLTYEFDLLAPDGHFYEVEIDARDGTILEIEDEDGGDPDDDD